MLSAFAVTADELRLYPCLHHVEGSRWDSRPGYSLERQKTQRSAERVLDEAGPR